MRYFVFDNGLEFLITKSKVYDEKAVVCSCVGDIKDDFERLKSLLIDMSDGEMDNEFISSLPISEVGKLSGVVANLANFSEKN
ncbi:hypothetical protein [uncultured Campylobacter sp.]|uniref:hypothetical protein n=1 Tax=uncultured Campylobacter sp. TaxID=218934 RepID=UPI00260C9EEC|nr:hypothetical protein [uncultured Campylobacter sp.]